MPWPAPHAASMMDLNHEGRGLRRNSLLAVGSASWHRASACLTSSPAQSTLVTSKAIQPMKGWSTTTYHFMFALFASTIVLSLVAAGLAGSAMRRVCWPSPGWPSGRRSCSCSVSRSSCCLMVVRLRTGRLGRGTAACAGPPAPTSGRPDQGVVRFMRSWPAEADVVQISPAQSTWTPPRSVRSCVVGLPASASTSGNNRTHVRTCIWR